VAFDGEKLNDALEGVGVDSEQLSPQHTRAILAICDLSLLFALSQHFIIPSFGECKGVPETMPPARAKSNSSNVIRFGIKNDYIPCEKKMSTKDNAKIKDLA
jgi:hypothetical protein